MRIRRIAAYRVELPLKEGSYNWSGGKSVSVFDSTPPEFLFTSTDFNSYVTVSTAEGAPQRAGGRLAASTRPGLGVEPRMEVLGDPVAEVS